MVGKRQTAAVVLALWAAATGARAEEPRAATVSWVRLPGAEGCMSARELAEAITARLGPQAIVVPTRAELFVEGRIAPSPEGEGYEVAFVMADAGGAPLGTREIASEANDCRAFDASIALVASLMIDPDAPLHEDAARTTAPAAGSSASTTRADARNASAATVEPASPNPARDAPPDEPSETASALPAPTEPRAATAPGDDASPQAPSRLGIHAAGTLGLGLLPGVPLGVGLRLELTPPGFVPIELAGAFFPERSDQLRAGAGADLLAAWGTLGVCPLVPVDAGIRVLGCVAVEGGTIASHGFGFDRSLDDESVVLAGALRVRAFGRIAGPLVIGVSASLSVPVLRPRFYALDPAGVEREVFRVAPLLGFFELSLGGDFL